MFPANFKIKILVFLFFMTTVFQGHLQAQIVHPPTPNSDPNASERLNVVEEMITALAILRNGNSGSESLKLLFNFNQPRKYFKSSHTKYFRVLCPFKQNDPKFSIFKESYFSLNLALLYGSRIKQDVLCSGISAHSCAEAKLIEQGFKYYFERRFGSFVNQKNFQTIYYRDYNDPIKEENLTNGKIYNLGGILFLINFDFKNSRQCSF